MKLISTFCRDNGGASALEFAMIFPIFIAMVLGTIQMGIVYYTAGSVQFALDQAARSVMVNPAMSTGQVRTAIESQLQTLTPQQVTVTYSVDNSGAVAVGEVNAAFSIDVVIPFVPSFSISFNAETHIPLLS